MKLSRGKLVLGNKPCNNCRGAGTVLGRKLCPDCKGTRLGPRGGKDGCMTCSKVIDPGTVPDPSNPITCPRCGGVNPESFEEETLYDSVDQTVLDKIPLKVFRGQHNQTLAEALLGVGLGSTTDYGRSANMTDEELLESVRAGLKYTQGIKIADKDTRKVVDFIAIITNNLGYSLVGVFKEPSSLSGVRCLV